MLDSLAQMRDLLTGLWKRRAVNIGARVLILAVIVWWITRHLDLSEAVILLSAPDPIALFEMIVCALLFAALGGLKIWTLLRALADVSLKQTVLYFLVASSIGAFTPAALGDFSLAAFLKRENVPTHEGLAIVFVDRLVSVSLYILIFTPLTLAFLAPNAMLWGLPFLYLIGGASMLGLNSSERVRHWVRVHLIERYASPAFDFLDTTSRLVRLYPLALAFNVLVGLVRCLVGGLVVWLALAVVGTHAPFFPIIAATNTLSVINLIPISFGGLGVYEGGGVLLFEAFGLDGTHALAGLVVQRSYVLVVSALFVVCATVILFWQRRNVPEPKEARTI